MTLFLPSRGASASRSAGALLLRLMRRRLVLGFTLAVVVAVGMTLGSWALVRAGDHQAAGQGVSTTVSAGIQSSGSPSTPALPGMVVTRVKNTSNLDPGVLVISIPLDGGKWKTPGHLYGSRAKQPVKLGPKNAAGMTQDAFSGQAGLLLPDGRTLLYHFWEQLADFPTEAPGDPVVADGTHLSTPTIRVYDLVSGEDKLLVSGARSLAWRSDGLFAYAQGVDPDYRYNVPYMQRVVVQQGLDGTPEVWTPDSDRYTVLQWVGKYLLVSRELVGGTEEVLLVKAPGEVTPLLEPGELFLASSPDGSQVLAANHFAGDAPIVRTVDVETASEVARFLLDSVLDPASGTPITGVSGAAWEDDKIVLAVSPADLLVLSLSGKSLALEDVISFSYHKHLAGSVESLYLDSAANRVCFIAGEGSNYDKLERTAVITYDLNSGESLCWTTPGVDAVLRFVCNPSRPR